MAEPVVSSAVPGDADADIASWYEIDGNDRVVAVCPEWDRVAREGGGGVMAMQGGVIGQPLRRFLSGDTTRMYMDAALQATRLTGRQRRLAYRCDTPTVRRSLEMTLVPLADGGVRIEHRLVDRQLRVAALVCRTERPPLAPAGVRTVWRCSVCLRLQRSGLPWQEPEGAGAPRLVVRYTVCPHCGPG